MSNATIILTREQSLEQALHRQVEITMRVMAFADETVRLAGGVIRENRILKQPIPRHRALVPYSPRGV